MTKRTFGGWQHALPWITVGLLWTQGASGQARSPDAGEPGDCMPSREAHECPDRCPSFDTCFIDDGDGQLYYRVGEERFECDGLDCNAASTQLGDYCCRRGEFAPSSGGGGCAMDPAGASESLDLSGALGAWLGLALLAVGRRRRGAR